VGIRKDVEMKLLPRFVKADMFMACCEESNKLVEVELWDKVGLAIHEYNDSVTDKWRISHFNSGRSILRHMKNRKEAIYYLMKVRDWETVEGLNIDWTMTEEQFRSMYNREEVIGMLIGLQKEISGERR
jgi:hypothetical protein